MVYRPFNKMEAAISLHGYSLDQQTSSENPNNNVNNPFISSRQHVVNHLLPPPSQYFHNTAILQYPPHYTSYPPPCSVQLPPLLPLPTTAHRHGPAAINRGLSFPPTPPHKMASKGKKKSKPQTKKKDHIKSTTTEAMNSPFISSPSQATKTTSTISTICGNKNQSIVPRAYDCDDECDITTFSGAVAFAVSPPPSSLPLPTFSLRPKRLNCKADAHGADNGGATDDLRRILRLR